MVTRTVVFQLVRAFGPTAAFLLAVASAIPAHADFASRCGSCHGIGGARVNAGDAPAVITAANLPAQHNMGVGAFAAEFAAIATEIGATFTPTQTRNVNFNSTGNSITVNNLVLDNPGAVITTTQLMSGPSRGTLSGVGTASSFVVSYSHTANNCLNDTIVIQGTGVANTSNRTITVTVNNPTVTASPVTVGAMAYSTGATSRNISGSIFVTNGGTPVGSLNLSGQVGTGTTSSTGPTTFTYAATGTTYSPSVTVNYTADGPCGTLSNSAQITIPVNLPAAPTAADVGPVVVPAGNGTATSVSVAGAIAGFRAASPLVIVAQPPAGQGTVTVLSPTQFTYTASGFAGSTSFTYNVLGPTGSGLTSTTQTVTLTPTDAPVASPGTATTAFNTPVTVDLTPFISGAFTSVSVSGGQTNGTAAVFNASSITFTPTGGFFGTGTFQFIATGPGGSSPAAATVSVTVNPPVPVVSNITANVAFSTPSPVDVAAGISAVPVTSVNAFAPVNGTITGVVGTVVTFNPTAGYIGPASFQFTATNIAGTSAPAATANLTVLAPPPPVASNLSVQVMNIGGTAIDLAGSITGFYNTISIVGSPTQGSVSVSGTVVTYTPIASTTGVDRFTYVANGPGGTSAPATVTVSPTGAPITPALSVTVPFNTVTTIDLSAAILNPFTSFTITSSPANGIVLVRGNVVTYTPNNGYFGPDSFTYTATGPGGTSAPGVVTLTVNPPIPVVVSQNVSVNFNTPTQINLAALVAGVATGFTVTTPPQHGTLTISGNIATYTPAPGYFGSDSFSFRATNGAGASSIGTVNITVGSVKPTAGAASLTVQLNTPASKDLAPFISGSGVQGVSISTEARYGTVTVNGTVVTYTPKHNFFGNDSFTYLAYGNLGSSAPGVVNVTVVGRPDPREDPAVGGLLDAMSRAARRFSQAQIGNYQRRMETLHRGPDRPDPVEAPKAEPAKPAAANPASDVAPSSRAPEVAPTTRAPGNAAALAANGRAPATTLGGQAAASAAASAMTSAITSKTPLPEPLVNALVSLATSHSVGLNGSAQIRDGTSVWMGGLGHFGNIDGNGERSGSRFSTDGISVGADRRFSDRLALGLGVGYARDDTSIGSDGSKTKTKGGSFAVYGSYQPTPDTFIDGLIGFGKLDIDSDRYVGVVDAFATGRRKGDQVFGSIAGGYEWRRDGVLVSPYGRLDFSSDKLKAATETGADQYNLAFAGVTQRSTQLAIGVRAESQHETEFGRATPRFRAEYRREFQDDRSASVSYADLFGGPEYSITSTGVSRNSLLLGIGSDFTFRGGLKLGIDYQNERASGARNVQSIRFLATQELDGKGLPAFRWTSNMFEKPVTVDAGYTFDDNVTRGRLNEEKRSDALYSVGVSQTWPFALTERTRLLVTGNVSGDKFRLYDGLGRFSAGVNAEYQFRPSSAYDAITWTAVGRAFYDQYESKLRTGSRYFLGANARRALTDKIDLFVEAGGNVRYGNSEVFNLKDYLGRFNFDYSLGARGTVYLGGEYRRGDTFASGFASLTNATIADVVVPDDAFDSGEFFAYRIDVKAWIGTLGWNYPLGPRDSLDFSWRRAQATPTTRPSFDFPGSLRYNLNQYSLVYLMRF